MFAFTIIIPHKDSLPFLKRCLNSIPRRDDIQVITIDDGSDISVNEWQDFTKDYSYVELITLKDSLGAGYARNVGLSRAKGKWILFADADDFFHNDAFAVLDGYVNSEFDTIFFYADSVDGMTLEKVEDRLLYVKRFFDEYDFERLPYRHMVPWGKMIRRDIIEDNHIRFEEIEVSNDVMFSARLASVVKNVGIINRPLYCYTINANSLVSKVTARRIIIRVKTRKRVNDFLHDNGLDQYRIPFFEDPWIWIKQLLPRHPLLFVWSIWESRYKGNFWAYMKELFSYGKNHLLYKMQLVAKKSKIYSIIY